MPVDRIASCFSFALAGCHCEVLSHFRFLAHGHCIHSERSVLLLVNGLAFSVDIAMRGAGRMNGKKFGRSIYSSSG